MDSMRSLDTSLPGTSPPKRHASETPEQLLQAFKAAALSVTQLYKTAVSDQARARAGGYQDALDELLSFLDREDIGLSDGEGWKIRRWATERLDGRESTAQQMESDDDTAKPERDSSPVLHRAQSITQLSTRTSSPVRTESAPPSLTLPILENPPTMLPPTSTFTFRSQLPYPQDAEMASSDSESQEHTRTPTFDTSVVNDHQPSSITITRQARTASRHNQGRHSTRGTGTIGRGAGQKRKINYSDFFDLGNLGHGKEGFGGGKRGRFA